MPDQNLLNQVFADIKTVVNNLEKQPGVQNDFSNKVLAHIQHYLTNTDFNKPANTEISNQPPQESPASVQQKNLAYANDNPLIAKNYLLPGYYNRLGQLYGLTTGVQNVAAKSFLLVQMTNPANSGKTIFIHKLSGGTSGSITIDVFRNAAFAPAGTPLLPRNRNWHCSDNSVIQAEFLNITTDPTTEGALLKTMIQKADPIEEIFAGSFQIPDHPAAQNFYLRLTNNTDQPILLAVNVSWWEE